MGDVIGEDGTQPIPSQQRDDDVGGSTTLDIHTMALDTTQEKSCADYFLRPATLSPMRLVFDFDGTITQHDTIGELAQSAIRRKKHQTQRDLQPAWDDAVRKYLQDHQSYTANFTPPESERRTVEEEERFLAGLRPIEEASLTRVSHSGLLAGLEKSDLIQMGMEAVSTGRVGMTEGCQDLLEEALRGGAKVDVLSVNWSKSFIEGVLHKHAGGVNVVANDVSEDGSIHGPSSCTPPGIMTARDKVRAFRRIVGEDQQVVYFGDSATDLTCLLLCRGIVLARDKESSSLLKTLSRIGTDVPHVGSAQDHTDKRLFWARNFREVMQSGVLDATT
ncbi:hypothetical protein C2857_003077 [Epichloe festucae Fl1]|uniref:Uncharacterized protein n=1 Tax=Epichloe festucae (strain Fl1) TaxID=877507 RepID=A0A7S9KS30_EPIFF|nr:hypothetical protein C2857_003077 [Epichloe festucae Fl1]